MSYRKNSLEEKGLQEGPSQPTLIPQGAKADVYETLRNCIGAKVKVIIVPSYKGGKDEERIIDVKDVVTPWAAKGQLSQPVILTPTGFIQVRTIREVLAVLRE